MATKTISITEDAYERLNSIKYNNESFSEVIKRVTSQISLIKLAGLLSKESVNILENSVLEGRKRSIQRRGMMIK